MSLSPEQIMHRCRERAEKQRGRIQEYDALYRAYKGARAEGGRGVKGSYPDGRPALQALDSFHKELSDRGGAPNSLQPIVDDRVSMMCPLPTMTFDSEADNEESVKQAEIASKAVRAQYQISQMPVAQTHAVFFDVLFGDACYTLDPLRPKDAKASGNPFAIPGVRINVQDPRFAYPRFGSGSEYNRIQDLFLYYPGSSAEEVEDLYPDVLGKLGKTDTVDVCVFYTTQYKVAVVGTSSAAVEADRDDHGHGFCPAEWAINRTDGSQFGVSEIDQGVGLNKSAQKLFHLAMDGVILETFPPMRRHNAEHVGRIQYGPLAVIDTVEDGDVQMLSSNVRSQVPMQLFEGAKGSLLNQTGTSPMRQDMAIQHANTSGRAIRNVQGPLEARMAMSNILLGSTLEWINAKVALILSTDKDFRNTELTFHGVEVKGKRTTVKFKGSDLGGIWSNHVQWSDPLGGSKHETLVMYLQLFKEGLVSGRKVLEAIGEDDPDEVLKSARLDQQQRQALQQAMAQGQGPQGAPPGGPPGPGGPTDMAQQQMALAAGGMPGGPAVSGPDANGGAPGGAVQAPPSGGGMPGFSLLAGAPGGPSGGPTPVPDVWGPVQQAASQLDLHGEVVGATTTPKGILVFATDHRDFGMLKMKLRDVAESIAGPGAKVEVQLAPTAQTAKGR